MRSGDGEGLPGGGAFRLCLNNDKIIGFTLEDGAAKGRGAFGSSTIPKGASTSESKYIGFVVLFLTSLLVILVFIRAKINYVRIT